jgi:hypothetical protein
VEAREAGMQIWSMLERSESRERSERRERAKLARPCCYSRPLLSGSLKYVVVKPPGLLVRDRAVVECLALGLLRMFSVMLSFMFSVVLSFSAATTMPWISCSPSWRRVGRGGSARGVLRDAVPVHG